MLPYLLALAIAEPTTSEPPPALTAAAPPHNYLKPPPVTCDKSNDAGEVVVCGDKDANKRYRLQPVDGQAYADPPIRAETRVAGGTLGLTANTVMVGGVPSNRVMLNFKIKF